MGRHVPARTAVRSRGRAGRAPLLLAGRHSVVAAPQGAKDRTATACGAGTLADHTLQFIGHSREFFHSPLYFRQVAASHRIDFVARQVGVVVQTQQAAYLVEAKTQFPTAADELKPVDIRCPVSAIAGAGPQWRRNEANALVVTDGFEVAAAQSGCLTDFHSHLP